MHSRMPCRCTRTATIPAQIASGEAGQAATKASLIGPFVYKGLTTIEIGLITEKSPFSASRLRIVWSGTDSHKVHYLHNCKAPLSAHEKTQSSGDVWVTFDN